MRVLMSEESWRGQVTPRRHPVFFESLRRRFSCALPRPASSSFRRRCLPGIPHHLKHPAPCPSTSTSVNPSLPYFKVHASKWTPVRALLAAFVASRDGRTLPLLRLHARWVCGLLREAYYRRRRGGRRGIRARPANGSTRCGRDSVPPRASELSRGPSRRLDKPPRCGPPDPAWLCLPVRIDALTLPATARTQANRR